MTLTDKDMRCDFCLRPSLWEQRCAELAFEEFTAETVLPRALQNELPSADRPSDCLNESTSEGTCVLRDASSQSDHGQS